MTGLLGFRRTPSGLRYGGRPHPPTTASNARHANLAEILRLNLIAPEPWRAMLGLEDDDETETVEIYVVRESAMPRRGGHGPAARTTAAISPSGISSSPMSR